MTCYQLHATFFGSKRCPGGNTQAHPQTVQTVHLNEGRTPFCTVSSQKINKQTNTVSRSSSSQTMLEGLCGCIMACNVFLAGNSEVSLVLQCFTAELITYIVCECDAPECLLLLPVQQSVPSAASYITLITVRLLRLETLLHSTNDSSIYVPTASSTLLFLSSVVGSLQGSLVRRKARPTK